MTFRVEHADFSATPIHAEDDTLRGLSESILEAVDFDSDPCYGFDNHFKNSHKGTEEYTLIRQS